MKIAVNKIRCRKCGDVIESTQTHDYKRCKCGKVAVDGGLEYLRRIGDPEDWEELSMREEEVMAYVPLEDDDKFVKGTQRPMVQKKVVVRVPIKEW